MNANSILLCAGFALLARSTSFAQSQQSPVANATPPPPLQRLTVVCMHYSPGDKPLHITDRFSALSPQDIALLQRCVLYGTAEVHEKGIYEDGPQAKVILLLTGPVQQQVIAAQPWHSCAIYLQEGQSLTILPKDVPLWDKRIYLEQQRDAPRYTTYMIDLTTGGRMGGSAGAW